MYTINEIRQTNNPNGKVYKVLAGTSEETKPMDLAGGSEYYETDTGIKFVYDEKDTQWKQREVSTVANQNKTVTANGTYACDAQYTGLGNVIVAIPLEESKTATSNGDVEPSEGYTAIKKVVVNVTANLQNKTVSLATLSAGDTITCDADYDGLGTITLEE